jgi:Domain of unknown function (DUF4258)
MRDHAELLALRAQLARAEKQARRAPPAQALNTPQHQSLKQQALKLRPITPQREQDLDGVDTRDFILTRAHARLRDAVWDGRYEICPHAVGHARAEGFLEQDIVSVLLSGRVRAVYPEDRRWLVCGYFEAHGFQLPLHVVVELSESGKWLDVVTAFVPKHPHHIVSRARLAVMLRWDGDQVQIRTAQPGNRVGNRGKGRWRKGA